MFNRRIKRIFSIALAAIFVVTLSACSNQATDIKDTKGDKPVIYATFFPVADLTSRIAGDKFEVKTVISASEEPHSFELSANKMKDISTCSLFVYNGASMESFAGDVESQTGKDKCLNLSQGLTLLEANGSTNHEAVNPHTWLSIKCACTQLDTIYRKLSSIDPENEAYYKDNLDKSLKQFEALDKKFEEKLSTVDEDKRYFVVSHAAFNYLAKDYGLTQVAVTGISPEDEPSAQQLTKIADFVKKHNISTIFFEGTATPKVAKTLANSTNAKTSTLWTMENLSQDEVDMGYITLMEKNLDSLMESFDE